MKINKSSLVISTLLISFASMALESDFEQPIHVSSVSQHVTMKNDRVVFQDDVLLTQGSIKLTADKLTVIRGKESNQEIMIAEGKVATFYQTQEDGKPINAEAKTIRYDVAKAQVTLTGNAQVKQLKSQINGSKIIYLMKKEELTVSNDGKETRVTTVFLPAQFDKKNTENTPEKEE
ncbi:lipopolysaccharide transport periplasmic protein LptA [Psychromonas sp. MB-3u-54]|uniref:lipopolysaccharide transport periplasmic protein LptA n=1 Tax=Psychromonas sp. MB-3u-54 TaxID=2058319 RepID=UPI000C344BA3|nr:lipopolysaccharide transport periplasmic protein LptA [Psychromonas sp. MB-3u-54]PKH01892.1 lipopolysaccharide transport periplasmic protein LptA [Psychromonas sp. MB-3u-54]